ncbi:MAG: hypothetical protein ACTSYQ_04955 [Candidatus Odinarchaeia archaeon]
MLHELNNPVDALKEINRVLKSKSMLILIDWIEGAQTGVVEKYYSIKTVISMLKQAGYRIKQVKTQNQVMIIKAIT